MLQSRCICSSDHFNFACDLLKVFVHRICRHSIISAAFPSGVGAHIKPQPERICFTWQRRGAPARTSMRIKNARYLLINMKHGIVNNSLHVLKRFESFAQLLRIIEHVSRRGHELRWPPNEKSAVDIERRGFQTVSNLTEQRRFARNLRHVVKGGTLSLEIVTACAHLPGVVLGSSGHIIRTSVKGSF